MSVRSLRNVNILEGRLRYGPMTNMAHSYKYRHGDYAQIMAGKSKGVVAKVEQPNNSDGTEYVVRLPNGDLEIYKAHDLETA